MNLIPIAGTDRVALVDDSDHAALSQFVWRLHSEGYAIRGGGNKKVYMHRQIMGFPDLTVDHKDHNRLNNTRGNLRLATRAQNLRNESPGHRTRFDSPSRFLGVSWDKFRRKWKAYVCVDYKTKWLGRFDTQEEAAVARDAAAQMLHGEFASLNSNHWPSLASK